MSENTVTLVQVVTAAMSLSPLDKLKLIEQLASGLEDVVVNGQTMPRRSLLGVPADLGPAPSAEEIDGARREAWSDLSEEALSRVWDNSEDALYDDWKNLYSVSSR